MEESNSASEFEVDLDMGLSEGSYTRENNSCNICERISKIRKGNFKNSYITHTVSQ